MPGLFDAIRNKAEEAMREMRKREEYVKSMSRGLDILPDRHKGKCGTIMAVRQIYPLTVCAVFLAAAYFFYDYASRYRGLDMLGIAFLILMAGITIRYILLLSSFIFGSFELYGGYILAKNYDTKIDARYRYSNGRLKNEYRGEGRKNLPYGRRSKLKAGYIEYYYANVNGVFCPITKFQYLFLKRDSYYYVIRVKHLIMADEYFFVKSNRKVENERTGNRFL